jgi:hypothetical protein
MKQGELFGIIPRVEEEVRNGKLCVNDGGVVHYITLYPYSDIGTISFSMLMRDLTNTDRKPRLPNATQRQIPLKDQKREIVTRDNDNHVRERCQPSFCIMKRVI